MSSKYDSFRSILDQLMGGDRDLLPDQKTNRQMHFSDDKVCKFFLCGLCPHELFTNTKSDLGPCTNLHDDDIKAQYDELPFEEKMTKYPYERDFIARMQKMVSDLDKRIDRGHQRLSLQDHENPLTPDKMEKMDAISEQIEMLLRQMEDLGAAGRLQEAQGLELQILKLKAEQEAIKKGGPGGSAVLSAQQQEKRLKVCEVCGAFLVVGDTDDRIKSHNDGKQHQGYYAIRTILEEKRKKMLEEGGSASRIIIRDDRDMSRGGRDRGDARGGRDSYSSSSRGRRDSRSGRDDYPDRDRDRDRSSSRDYRDYRDRDRDRDREGRDYREYRDRDRDRDRDSRRDRDREYRDRDRDGGSSRRRSEDEEAHGGARKREREREREPAAAAAASPTESAANGAEDPDSAERKRRRAEE